MEHSNRRIGESTVADHDSRESTVDVIGDAADGDDRDDSDGNIDLPTLEDLLSEAKAMRRVAVSEPGQELPVGESAAGESPGADAHVGSSPDGSQGEQSTFQYVLPIARGHLLT